MKNNSLLIICCMMCIMGLSSCYTSSGLNPEKSIEENVTYYNLAERLRTMSGIQVLGNGDDVNVVIRGIQSFGADPNPIYVVDGLNMGRSYRAVNAAIDVNQIKRLRILKSKSETAIYGEQGNNGVILITMAR